MPEGKKTPLPHPDGKFRRKAEQAGAAQGDEGVDDTVGGEACCHEEGPDVVFARETVVEEKDEGQTDQKPIERIQEQDVDPLPFHEKGDEDRLGEEADHHIGVAPEEDRISGYGQGDRDAPIGTEGQEDEKRDGVPEQKMDVEKQVDAEMVERDAQDREREKKAQLNRKAVFHGVIILQTGERSVSGTGPS